jgi:hypothetical protein
MVGKIADDKVIVAEAQKKFGHLSDGVRDAAFLKPLAIALRALAHETATTNPAVCEKVLDFTKEHKLSGYYGR